MEHAIRINKSILECPYCKYEIAVTKDNVTPVPAPKGSGGCVAYARCPFCKLESCVERDEPELKPVDSDSDFHF